MEYIVKILRTLFFNIDRVVYAGIGNVYDLLLRIARTTIIDSETLSGFYTRIYALIGIFMLFKISLSIINYVINPDQFTDKDKGFSSIIKRVVLSLIMLVLFPYAFKEAYALQAIILEDNVLASVVFGSVENNSTYTIDTAGDKIKFILMYTFFQPNYNGLYEETGASSLASCAITYEYDSSGKVVEENGIFVLNSECFGTKSGDTYDGGTDYANLWKNSDLYQTYVQGIARQNFNLMFKNSIAMLEKDGSEGVYLVDYMAPLSTAVGVAVLWVLLIFCIDIAVRSVKLAFFELIAPIPILSYIDPKSKDGMFSKWLKQCGTTYASLFMRLLALYVAIYLISEVSTSGIKDVVTGERITDWWVCIFVIIGVLIFAKQLPKVLEDALGIKGIRDFTLNPMKKLEKEALGGKLISGAGKRAVGTAKGVGTAALVGGAALATGQGFRLGAMGKAVAGGFKGEKFGKNFATSYGAGRARKKQLDQMKADGVSRREAVAAKAYNAFHGETKAEKVSTLENQAKAIQSYYDTIKNQAVACDSTDVKAFNPVTGKEEIVTKSAKTISKELDEMKKTTISRSDYATDDDYNDAITKQRLAIKDKETELENRINALAGGASTGVASADKVISEATKSMEALVKATNELGKSLDSGFVEVSASGTDVVQMMKQSKGTVAQASSGTFSHTKDIGKYADGSKK